MNKISRVKNQNKNVTQEINKIPNDSLDKIQKESQVF